MEWVAEYDNGDEAHEREYGSLRHVPELHRVVRLRVGSNTLSIPPDATPIWLRRHSLNATTGAHAATTMIGWERDDERHCVWIDGNGAEVEEPD